MPLGDGSPLSFCELYHLRQKYNLEIKSMHSKYIAFELPDLKDISPAYICAMSKVYIPDNAVSLMTIYSLALFNLLRELVDRNEEIFPKILETFNKLYYFLITIID